MSPIAPWLLAAIGFPPLSVMMTAATRFGSRPFSAEYFTIHDSQRRTPPGTPGPRTVGAGTGVDTSSANGVGVTVASGVGATRGTEVGVARATGVDPIGALRFAVTRLTSRSAATPCAQGSGASR